jgi:archaellum component FlaC
MRHSARTILRLVLPVAVILISSYVLAQEQPKVDQTSGTKREASDSTPDLADIMPLATKLSGDLATLENSLTGILNISEFEEKYARIEENLKDPVAQLQQITNKGLKSCKIR